MIVRPLNLVKVVSRLLELGVEPGVVKQALVYGGLPERLADRCLEHAWRAGVERLVQRASQSLKGIKEGLERVLRSIEE